MRPRRLPPCLAVTAVSAALLFVLLLLCASSSPPLFAWRSSAASRPAPLPPPPRAEWGPGRPPSFAYWISGTGGDARRVLRLLRAVYHPRNRYLLHLDAGAAAGEREALARAVRQDEPAWREFRNVDVVGEAYAVDRTGSSALAAVLHGAAVLLRIGAHWDWLVTLSAEDYPLVTQDGKRKNNSRPLLLSAPSINGNALARKYLFRKKIVFMEMLNCTQKRIIVSSSGMVGREKAIR